MGRVVIFFLFLCYSFRPRSFSFDTRLIFPELPGDRQSQKCPTQRQHTPPPPPRPRKSGDSRLYMLVLALCLLLKTKAGSQQDD